MFLKSSSANVIYSLKIIYVVHKEGWGFEDFFFEKEKYPYVDAWFYFPKVYFVQLPKILVQLTLSNRIKIHKMIIL